MYERKSNKSIAGYHLLMILSAVDYKFHPEEEKVIQDYMLEEFPFRLNLDNETAVIAELQPSEWKKHFEFHAQCFYDDSTEEERLQFIDFAKKLIKASDDVSNTEHQFYTQMKKIWNL